MNIIERAITPFNPATNTVQNRDKYNLFAPMAGTNKIGMAGFNPRDFSVNEQIVSLKEDAIARFFLKIDVNNVPEGIRYDGPDGIKTPNVWYYNYENGFLLVGKSNDEQIETYFSGGKIYTRVIYISNGNVISPVAEFKDITADVIAELEALELLVDTKLDKFSTGFTVYAQNEGTQTNVPYSSNHEIANSIVQRTEQQISVPVEQTQDNHATSKAYVDSKSDILTEAIESLAEDVETNTDNITDLSGKVENLYNSSSVLIMPNHEFMQEPSGKLMYQARNRNCTDEELEDRVFELENNISAINESFTGLQEQVLYIDNNLENTNGEVIELQNEVSELRGLVSILIGVSPIMVEPHGDFMYDPQNSLMLNN